MSWMDAEMCWMDTEMSWMDTEMSWTDARSPCLCATEAVTVNSDEVRFY